MKTIEISDETWLKIKDQVEAESGKVKEKTEKKFEIKSRWTGAVIYSSTKTTYKDVLEEARASAADLRGANLRNADLRGANLRNANLSAADLRGANLSAADLYDANLCGANLSAAELQNAKFLGKGGTTRIKKNQLDDFFKALGIVCEE